MSSINDNEDDSKNTYKCNECDRLFSRKVQYEKHIRQHIIPVPEVKTPVSLDCKLCGKTLKNARSLKLHSQRHKAKNKIACVICGKTFCQRTSLKIHLRVHTQSKKAPREDTETESKRYDCEMCDKYFSSLNDLKKHRNATHDGKPFACKICNERFSWRDQLASHYCAPEHEVNVKTESEDNLSASSITTRNIDLYQITDDQVIACGICQRQFSQKGHLILHYRRGHNRELLIEKVL